MIWRVTSDALDTLPAPIFQATSVVVPTLTAANIDRRSMNGWFVSPTAAMAAELSLPTIIMSTIPKRVDNTNSIKAGQVMAMTSRRIPWLKKSWILFFKAQW